MLGVDDEAGVEHFADRRRRLVPERHVVEVRGVVEVGPRVEDVVAAAQAGERGHQRRQRGQDSQGRVPVAGQVFDAARRVEQPHRRDAGLEGVHRVARGRHRPQQVFEAVVQLAALPQLVVEVGEFALRGQLALEEQPARLLVGTLLGEDLDGDAAVLEAGALAVDEADGGLRGDHVFQARTVFRLSRHGDSRRGSIVRGVSRHCSPRRRSVPEPGREKRRGRAEGRQPTNTPPDWPGSRSPDRSAVAAPGFSPLPL